MYLAIEKDENNCPRDRLGDQCDHQGCDVVAEVRNARDGEHEGGHDDEGEGR